MSALQTVQQALERRRAGAGANSRNPYARAVGAAAALVTLAGIGVGLYVYARWTPDSQPGQGGDDWAAGGGHSRRGTDAGTAGPSAKGKTPANAGGAAGESAPAPRRGPRPTLSLSLPPSFDRTSSEALQLIHDLVAVLAEHFLIHLILPDSPSSPDAASTPTSSVAPDGASSSGTGALAAVFADVLDFDARRLLLYSTGTGRQALSLALACDAHVEVAFAHGAGAAGSADGEQAETIKRIEHLQRTAGVVVLLLLPSPAGHGSGGDALSPLVLEHFKKASFSRSVRIIETYGADAQDVAEQWQLGADRIVELRAKMKR